MHLSESAGIAKKEPLVSIVIPVYNVGAYLSECLESLMNQTYRNIEMVVIDDGSTDDSSVICDQYAEKDSRIRVFHQNNHGMSHARNRGITLARGDYLQFIDSDDWMEINAIETLVHTMQQSQADIVTAGLFADYTDKTVISANKREQITIVKGQEILRTFYDGVIRDLAWNKLYRIDVFKEIRFPVDRYYEDIATTWKIMKNLSETDGVIVVLPDYLYHYRVRKGSISHGRSFKNVTDYWDAYIVQYNAFPAYRKTSRCALLSVPSSSMRGSSVSPTAAMRKSTWVPRTGCREIWTGASRSCSRLRMPPARSRHATFWTCRWQIR